MKRFSIFLVFFGKKRPFRVQLSLFSRLIKKHLEGARPPQTLPVSVPTKAHLSASSVTSLFIWSLSVTSSRNCQPTPCCSHLVTCQNEHSHLSPRPFFFNVPQNLHCEFEPERGSFNAPLADTARELELALAMFESCVPSQPCRFTCKSCRCDPSVIILFSHNFRNMLRPRSVNSRLDVHAGDVHRRSFLAAVPYVLPSVLLPPPLLLQQLRQQYLTMLTAETVKYHHVQLLPAFWFFFRFQPKNYTGTHTTTTSLTSNVMALYLLVPFLLTRHRAYEVRKQFHNLPGTGSHMHRSWKHLVIS